MVVNNYITTTETKKFASYLEKKTSLTPPLFIEMPVPSQERERSCICVLGVLIGFEI